MNLVVYLTDRRISQDQIEIIGVGQDSPVASNDKEQGRVLNRRVETIIRFIE